MMLTRSQVVGKEVEFFALPYKGRLFAPKYYPLSKLYHSSSGGGGDCFKECMIEKSNTFQTIVMNELERRIGARIPQICWSQGIQKITDKRKEIKHTLAGKEQPILSRIPIKNSVFHLYGILPLLIRNDYLPKVFPEQVLQRLATLSLPLHGYTPVFIGYKTIHLDPKDEMMVKMDEDIKYYMYKLFAANETVKADYGLIIGRMYKTNKKTYTHALERVGVVNLKNIAPAEIHRRMRYSPSTNTTDFTLYRCSEKEFDHLRAQGIETVHDPRCTVEAMGLKETDPRVPLLREILKTQQGEALIRPEHIVFPPTNKKRLFVDFETIMSVLNDPVDSLTCQRDELIFMIGIGEEVEGEWIFHKLLLEELTLEAERKLLQQFFDIIKKEPSIIYCWTSAELRFLTAACRRNGVESPEIHWMDLYEYFNSVPITIKGCYNFKLKSVAKAMLSHGMISTEYGDLVDGTECSAIAVLYYKGHHPERVMHDILQYNEVDCKVMWEIVQYLRKKE